MSNATNYDIIVVGAGPAGYSAAIRSAQLGASVLLVEKGGFGGTCLNRGCIPTKFLWEAVSLAKKMKRAVEFGLNGAFTGYNIPLMQQRKARTTEMLGKSLRKLLESHSVALLEGTAKFISRTTIEIAAGGESLLTAHAPKIIIATGSIPKNIPGLPFDHTRIIDSTDALNLTEAPPRLLIVGGGAIGVEFATLYANLGSEILLAEREHQLLPGEDAELAREVEKLLKRLGVKVATGAGSLENLVQQYDKIIVVAGRQPALDNLALDKASVAYSPRGVTVNDYLETTTAGIFAAGDAAGRSFLAYTAQAEGIVAAENAMGNQHKAPDCGAVPRVVFCQPPAASVGAKESDLPGDAIIIGRFPLAANSRAFIEGERPGWVKLLADKNSGRIIGGQIIGPHAEDLIAIVSMAVRCRLALDDLRRELFFHPSLSESIHAARETAGGICVELPPPVKYPL
jgi:dihydrolipoamide dehydrogenase